MSRILATFDKKPAEVQDFDIDFTPYLGGLTDTGASHTVVADTGITVASSTLAAGIVKVWLSGGTDKTDYLVRAVLTTTGGRVHYGIIKIVVRA